MWAIYDKLARRSRKEGLSPDDLPRLTDEENEVHDLFRRYHYMYDAGDVEGVMELFTDDCVVVNPRGTYVGITVIRQNYEYLVGRRRFVLHYGTNPLVRFEPGLQEAWLGAFYLAVTTMDAGNIYATGGAYMNRLHNREGQWKIFEQRITGNFRFDLAKSAQAFTPPPTGTSARSSTDMVEDWAIF